MSATLTITRGLPGSGKSTWAAQQEAASGGTVVRVNRDDLRFEMFGKYHGLSGRQEGEVTVVQQARARAHLDAGRSVIIDDTNLNGRTVSSWRDLTEDYDGKAQFKVQDFPIDVEECIRRDNGRKAAGQRFVGESVIRSMSRRSMQGTSRLPRLPRAIYREIPVPPSADQRPHAVIFDIDGTLCDVRSVRHHVRPDENGRRNFHAFHMDSIDCPPHPYVADILRSCQEQGLKIVIVTAREQRYQDLTERWLAKNNLHYDHIFTRGLGDPRPDYEAKKDILAKVSKHVDVVHAVDDNPQVLTLWKENNIATTIVPGFDDPVEEVEPDAYPLVSVNNPVTSGKCLRCGKRMTTPGVLGPTCKKKFD